MLTDLYQGALADAAVRESQVSLADLEKTILDRDEPRDAMAALAPGEFVKVIAEIKRASPSRGMLAEIADPQALAQQYETGGASVISVLTEERKFHGSLEDMQNVRKAVHLPVLRKDFIATPYQVFEARAHGADLVLLIVAGLEQAKLEELYALTLELGMTPLVETHSVDEVSRAVDLGAELIGVNARDLQTFELDKDLFARVADNIPTGVTRIAESAVLSVADVEHYAEAGADAVLIGEALVTGDPLQTLAQFTAVRTQ